MVQGYNLDFSNSDRRGRMVVPHDVKKNACAAVVRARARVFNLLPIWIRTLNGVTVDHFKAELDKFLGGVPDQPTVPGRQRAATSNSLLDQLQIIF